jgi:hypothetical protein
MFPASVGRREYELLPLTQPKLGEEDLVETAFPDSAPLLQPSIHRPIGESPSELTLSGITCVWLFSRLPLSLQAHFHNMATKEKVKVWANKLAVESEPGLTNAQLMLTNHDLKPVEPERRQWGPWNFVGFWVADSFNIVSSQNVWSRDSV